MEFCRLLNITSRKEHNYLPSNSESLWHMHQLKVNDSKHKHQDMDLDQNGLAARSPPIKSVAWCNASDAFLSLPAQNKGRKL
jgi:hypothetical protein